MKRPLGDFHKDHLGKSEAIIFVFSVFLRVLPGRGADALPQALFRVGPFIANNQIGREPWRSSARYCCRRGRCQPARFKAGWVCFQHSWGVHGAPGSAQGAWSEREV